MSARGVLTTAVKMQIVQTSLEASRASAGRATLEMASDVKVRCSSAVWLWSLYSCNLSQICTCIIEIVATVELCESLLCLYILSIQISMSVPPIMEVVNRFVLTPLAVSTATVGQAICWTGMGWTAVVSWQCGRFFLWMVYFAVFAVGNSFRDDVYNHLSSASVIMISYL